MTHPFLRPREVHTEALILVGYRLYPCARIELHPRLTLLAGGNGAGKTTILDALQTVLIADQRYLHLNVAAGQNDRDMSGQLQGRTAWAALQLDGHEKVTAIGVHLACRAASEYVDLKPFALMSISPEQGLFLSPEQSEVTRDLKALALKASLQSSGGRVKEFASINDYHRFLYDEGILPLDLSRGGKRQFSLLWRQATQPHLGELNLFLQKTLCHEPEKRLTFDDVERLMRERLHTERQLNRLGELKALNAALCEKAAQVDHHRRLTLAISLGQLKQREEAIERDIHESEGDFRQLDEQIRALKEELEKQRRDLSELGKKRDGYLREQGEWGRRHKHHLEYVAHRGLEQGLQEEISWLREDTVPIESRTQEIRGRIEKTRSDIQALSNDLARQKEKEGGLERQARKWIELRKDLDRASAALGKEIQSIGDLEEAWARVSDERRAVQELKPLRQLLAQWESRARAHDAALAMAKGLHNLWPDFFGQQQIDLTLLDAAQTELRGLEKHMTIKRDELSKERKANRRLVDELSKCRIPLPAAASDLVEQGLASPLVNRFDTLDLEAARDCQGKVGPLAQAIVPDAGLLRPLRTESLNSEVSAAGKIVEFDADGGNMARNEASRLSELAQGDESFWLLLSPDAWKKFRVLARSRHGVIAHYGDIAWYSPRGPVWIGEEARRDQARKAQERLIEIEAECKELAAHEELISRRLQSIRSLLPKVEALSDGCAVDSAAELREKVREMERIAPGIEKLFPLIQRLFQRSELFDFVEAPEQMEALKLEIEAKRKLIGELEESCKYLRKEESECVKETASLQSKLHALDSDRNRVQTICSRLEEEEPLEVLLGNVDFGRAEELAIRIEDLDKEKEKIESSLFQGERKNGELRNRYKVVSETLARLNQDRSRARTEHERALQRWKKYYPEEVPHDATVFDPNERERHKALWDNLAQELSAMLAEAGGKYEFQLPQEEQPDSMVGHLIALLLPPGVQLDQLESQYSRLQHELQQIEHKIKSHVEEVRSNVEMEVRRMRMRLIKVNRILSTLSFGQIRKIYLEMEELPAYQTLQKLESVLRMTARAESISLKEFVQKLREFILRESNTTLSEEQIADYRSYIRIKRIIVDRDERARDSGLSSGETLGVNLALCLAVLFFLGSEQGADGNRGTLLLALDEAERLDAKALETIRDLLDTVRCQLTVAMPRPVDIPDSICHLLTPLGQGVTHVHLYHRGGNGATDILRFRDTDGHGVRTPLDKG
jgi:DNA repair exonuclease SbcCD ATPase subunit